MIYFLLLQAIAEPTPAQAAVQTSQGFWEAYRTVLVSIIAPVLIWGLKYLGGKIVEAIRILNKLFTASATMQTDIEEIKTYTKREVHDLKEHIRDILRRLNMLEERDRNVSEMEKEIKRILKIVTDIENKTLK